MILKRVIDLVISVIALLVLLIPFAVIALAIKLDSKGSVFFRQERLGLNGEVFSIWKLRTMTNARGEQGNLLPDRLRLTPLGRRLRGSSLDELPGLLNVIRGEMSLVGPRPLIVKYDPFFTEEERRRFDMRPGITGLALVRGRNELSWDQRIAADIQYVEHWTLWMDILIMLKTLWYVLLRRGLRIDPGAEMLDFDEERKTHSKHDLGRT